MTHTPYIFWTNTQLKKHLKNLTHAFEMPDDVRFLIVEVMRDPRWNPTKDYDGCSVVQDMYHPCTSCFLHDALWKLGMGGKESDELFYYLMLIEGMKPAQAKRRWFAVRMGWIFYYKWAHFKKRNVNGYSGAFIDALEAMRKWYAGREIK